MISQKSTLGSLIDYILDTLVWSKPATEGIPPSPRRAHTTCLWNDKIVVMGGGDGARALADVHILDISDPSRPRWSQLSTSGVPPIARGYHTSNLVKDKLIVFGGSDGHECFSDVHVLDLGKWYLKSYSMMNIDYLSNSYQSMDTSGVGSHCSTSCTFSYTSGILCVCDWRT